MFGTNSLIMEFPNVVPVELLEHILSKVKENDSLYFIGDNLKREKYVLDKELQKHILLYMTQINRYCGLCGNTEMILPMNLLQNVSELVVERRIFCGEDETEPKGENRLMSRYKIIGRNDHVKILSFIWFFNDFDGEIIFAGGRTIRPEAGKLLIFPTSWCFSHSEYVRNNSDVVSITGYVYQ